MLVHIKIHIVMVHDAQYGLPLTYLHAQNAIHFGVNLGKLNKWICPQFIFKVLDVDIFKFAAYQGMAAGLQYLVNLLLINKILTSRYIHFYRGTQNRGLFCFNKTHKRNKATQAKYPGKANQQALP